MTNLKETSHKLTEESKNNEGLKKDNSENAQSQDILPNITVTDPRMAQALMHKDKYAILLQLIPAERKIIELAELCKINSGTIKRYLDDLIAVGLVTQSRVIINRQNIKQKYYRAVAAKFIIHIELP
jgi:DNA-binding MarR family transcriptional regulator